MSTINPTQAFKPDGTPIPIVDASEVGLNGLSSETFMKLLITQLQNQDPTEPVSNEALLSQISQMQSLQSNIELSDTLEGLASSQSSTSFTSAAASFIGKEVSAFDDDGQTITGTVDRALFKNGKTFIGIGDSEIPIENVQAIREATT